MEFLRGAQVAEISFGLSVRTGLEAPRLHVGRKTVLE